MSDCQAVETAQQLAPETCSFRTSLMRCRQPLCACVCRPRLAEARLHRRRSRRLQRDHLRCSQNTKCAGHGSQKRDYTGDEADGYNETICPCDFQSAGQIVDDELNASLVRPIPDGCILHCLLDACHSGTGMDLPYIATLNPHTGAIGWGEERSRCAPATCSERIRPPTTRGSCGLRLNVLLLREQPARTPAPLAGARSAAGAPVDFVGLFCGEERRCAHQVRPRGAVTLVLSSLVLSPVQQCLCRNYKGTSGGLAVQFGACKDSQTAADTTGLSGDNTSTGAATFLFVQAIEHLSKQHQALTCVCLPAAAAVGKCPKAPSNLRISGTVHSRLPRHCARVVCSTIAVPSPYNEGI